VIKKLTTFIFILIATCVQAQEENVFKPHIYIGVVTSQVGGDRYAGFNKLGFQGGLGVKTKFSETIGLGMDIGYIQKGSRKVARPKVNDFSFYRMSIHYVELPVYMTYYQDRFSFDVGLSVAFLLKSSEETEVGFASEDDFGPFNDLDFSFLLGFEYDLNDRWKFQTRFSNSFIPFRDFEGDPIGPIQAGQYHSVLMFKIIRQIAQ
jgi:hypothetical protein